MNLAEPLQWNPYEVGSGCVRQDCNTHTAQRVRLEKGACGGEAYSNAQIDDYHHLKRADFLWHPPLKLSLRARFSHAAASEHRTQEGHLSGTAGFGFWNDPFMMTGKRRPTLPRAIWFFYASPPSDMQLALDVPGWGWKAAAIDCHRPAFYALLPTTPIGVLLMRSPFLYRCLWPTAQRAMHVQEQVLDPSLTEWRQYELEWHSDYARFVIDGALVAQTTKAPRGPLGLVIWLDNQSMVVTPTGRIRSGLVATRTAEFLEIEDLAISRL